MQKDSNSKKKVIRTSETQKKFKKGHKMTNKEKAKFSEQNSVDMFPVDPYND